MDILAAPDVRVLQRKSITMDRSRAFAFRRNGHGLDELQASETGSFILQLVVAELAQAVVLPPFDLLLAPVEVEDVGEEPSRVLLGRSVLRVGRNSCEQLLSKGPRVLAVDLLLVSRLSGSRGGSIDPCPVCDPRRPLPFEPVAERAGREAVVLVVSLDARARLCIDLAGSP